MGADGTRTHVDAQIHFADTPDQLAHHYCMGVANGVNECLIYLSDDADAPLVAVEDVVDAATFESLSADEQSFWHSNDEEAANGSEPVLPDAGEEQVQAFKQSMGGTYGKLVRLWNLQDGLPLGQPEVIYPAGTGQQAQ